MLDANTQERPAADAAPRSTLKQLESVLGGLSKESTADVIQNNLQLITQIGEQHNLTRLLHEILADDEVLGQVAGRSYRHVNLFDKIVLVANDAPDGYRLTLHLWRPPYNEMELRQELIHEHRFSFWSTVVTGTLVSEAFERGDHGQEYGRFRYVPEVGRKADFNDFYEYCGPARLSCEAPTIRKWGEAYYLDSSAIHRILLPTKDVTATLVLRGPRLSECNYVYNTSYPNGTNVFKNRMYSSDELGVRLNVLLGEIQAHTPALEDLDAIAAVLP